MSRPRYIYTPEQLLALQHSPLIKKPDDLPRIEQWVELPPDQAQRHPRTQGGLSNGKGEESEPPGKRTTPFEGRQRQGLPQSGDEIFLGPKMSFASASAARQTYKKGAMDGSDKISAAANHESRDKYDRFGTKEKLRRDGFAERDGRDKEQDGYRNRYSRLNGSGEDGEGRGKRGVEAKETRDGGVSLDGQSPRRTAPLRSRLDHPWHRDGSKVGTKDDRTTDEATESRGWRDSDRRNDRWNARDNRQEQDPQWMAEPVSSNADDYTQDDFQKWKERMKAGTDPKPQTQEEPLSTESAPTPTYSTADNAPINVASETSFFGIWGEPKAADATKSDALPQTPKAVSKPKASRFANMFKDVQVAATPAPVESPPQHEATSPSHQVTKNTAEDQEGFERMMQMLRMGGSSSQGPQAQALRAARPAPLGEDPARDQHISVAPDRTGVREVGSGGEATSPISLSSTQPGQRPGQIPPGPQRPQLQTRDSSFLLKLMQQPQTAPGEGQIYGQGYERRETNNGDSSLPNYPPPQRDLRPGLFPPGFPSNDGPGSASHNVESQYRANDPMRFPHQMQMSERFGGPMPRYNPGDEPLMQQRNMFDQFAPPNNNRVNPQQLGHDVIPPPPGFSTSRGQGPPGFYFPGNSPIAQQQPQQQPQQQSQQPQFGNNPVPSQRGPMQHPGFPPGFYDNGSHLPPGLQMHMGNQQPNRGPQMRQGPPLPQGQEGYRQPPPPMQTQGPPHFVKQMGGGYPGM